MDLGESDGDSDGLGGTERNDCTDVSEGYSAWRRRGEEARGIFFNYK